MIDSKKIVTANVRRLLEHRGGKLPEGQSGVSRLKALGVSHGNAQRALSDEGMRLATLDEIAHAFKMKPWQLLVPNLHPDALPTLAATGSPIEPPSAEHVSKDSPKSEPEGETVFDGLDGPGRELLGDVVSAVRRHLLPEHGEGALWSSRKSKQAQQDTSEQATPATKVGRTGQVTNPAKAGKKKDAAA